MILYGVYLWLPYLFRFCVITDINYYTYRVIHRMKTSLELSLFLFRIFGPLHGFGKSPLLKMTLALCSTNANDDTRVCLRFPSPCSLFCCDTFINDGTYGDSVLTKAYNYCCEQLLLLLYLAIVYPC